MPLSVTLLDQGTTVIDSSNAPPDNQISLGLVASGKLVVDGVSANISNIIGGGILSSTTIQAINGAHVTVGSAGLGLAVGSSFHYDIGAQSSVALNGGGLLSVGLLNNATVDFSAAGGTGSFAFAPPALALNLTTPMTITGLSTGDQISIVGATGATLSGGVLTFSYPGLLGLPTPLSFNVQALPPDASVSFNAATGGVTYACFLRGTRIATPRGEIAVEDLRPGDSVLTLDRGRATIRWIGRRILDPHSIDRPGDALPIRIGRGALAENIPHRDLFLSPDHCLFLDYALIPAKLLINGRTIVQDDREQPFEYFHVELDRHEVVIAEGALAETYIDVGNRDMFGAPGYAQIALGQSGDPVFCYPPVYDASAVEEVRLKFAARAVELASAA